MQAWRGCVEANDHLTHSNRNGESEMMKLKRTCILAEEERTKKADGIFKMCFLEQSVIVSSHHRANLSWLQVKSAMRLIDREGVNEFFTLTLLSIPQHHSWWLSLPTPQFFNPVGKYLHFYYPLRKRVLVSTVSSNHKSRVIKYIYAKRINGCKSFFNSSFYL